MPISTNSQNFCLEAVDALCAVLGEFAEVSGRVSTRIPEWRDLDGKSVPVDAPDCINVVGGLASGAEVSRRRPAASLKRSPTPKVCSRA